LPSLKKERKKRANEEKKNITQATDVHIPLVIRKKRLRFEGSC
jgi:hypothetical protein